MASAETSERDRPRTADVGTERRGWSHVGSASAFVSAAGAIGAGVASGVTEPTGVAALVALFATAVAYGWALPALALALRAMALAGWWTLGTAALAAAVWLTALVLVLFGLPGALAGAATALETVVGAVPVLSALWLIVASADVVRSGHHRWSLVAVGMFTAALIVSSVVIALPGLDIRKALVPLGWAIWMLGIERALRAPASPMAVPSTPSGAGASCLNCGAPRRADGLAFCADCGLPYGARQT